jgi:hypothetical protein
MTSLLPINELLPHAMVIEIHGMQTINEFGGLGLRGQATGWLIKNSVIEPGVQIPIAEVIAIQNKYPRSGQRLYDGPKLVVQVIVGRQILRWNRHNVMLQQHGAPGSTRCHFHVIDKRPVEAIGFTAGFLSGGNQFVDALAPFRSLRFPHRGRFPRQLRQARLIKPASKGAPPPHAATR